EQLYSEPLLKITDKIITGESKPFSFELGITENGNYVLELLVEGSDAGYEKRRFEFSISGGVERQSDCTATAAEGGAVLSEGVCVTRYLCENCENASECKWAWNEKQPELSFELSGPDYAVAETEANEWGCGDKPPEPPEPPEPPPNGTDGWTCKGAVPDAGILKMVDDYAARNKVPIDLARAVACTENDFKHGTTLNDSGAVGIMQIVVPSKKKAAAGQECINSGIIGGEQDLYNLEDNIACGTWYLRLTYDRHHAKYCCLPAGTPCFTGWEAALRAYNGAYCMVGSGSSVYVTTVLSHCPSKEACGIFEAET
ncbi:MAG: transglycosylase SLT domain-containing protein, partial [Candidatus Diapherotrites archaeon]